MKRIEQIPFKTTLAPLQGARMWELAPFDGHIIWVTIHWPKGCNALVDVAVWHGPIPFCPSEGYLALDNATPTYEFNEEVKVGDTIWVQMLNGDGGNPHDITATVSVREA